MAPTQFFALAAAAVLALSASVVSAIPSGDYFVTANGGYLGRGFFEDRSSAPKQLFLLQSPQNGDAVWAIEDLGSGRHKITVGGDVLGNIDGELRAILDRDASDTWSIVPVGRSGTYKIMPYGQKKIGVVSPKNNEEAVKIGRKPTAWNVMLTKDSIVFPDDE
ncbi:hypothetical protein BGW42_005531 [Actinomortierella wolfii]|nr:hypothetical protein BGW42_005531 [Actinomortierella wolfii]